MKKDFYEDLEQDIIIELEKTKFDNDIDTDNSYQFIKTKIGEYFEQEEEFDMEEFMNISDLLEDISIRLDDAYHNILDYLYGVRYTVTMNYGGNCSEKVFPSLRKAEEFFASAKRVLLIFEQEEESKEVLEEDAYNYVVRTEDGEYELVLEKVESE